MKEKILRKQIRNLILFLMACITLSGITAFPLESEMKFLSSHSGYFPSALSEWIQQVYSGLRETNLHYPFLSYGTDWLAFAHLIIALLFVGPLRDPVKNKWIIDWAILCCLLAFPLAFICGPIRSIPLFHRFIDCSFGVIGIIPLMIVRKKIKELERLITTQSSSL